MLRRTTEYKMVGERRENIMPVEVAIQRELAYRRKVAMLQFTLDEDLKDLMPLQVLSSHSSPIHSLRPLEWPSASVSPSPVPSTNHSVPSSLSSPNHSPIPLEGPSSSPSPSSSPVPSTNLSGIKRKELTNCLQYLQPEQPGLSHGTVMLKDQIDNLFCKICQVQCSGAFNLEQHFKGRKHKAKVEELELNRKYGGEKANQLQCCELCKVTCMNETLLKLHLQGKKHKEKRQQLEFLQHGEEIPNQPQWCELCKVTCMNETLLKQHFQGKKHQDKLQELESLKHGEEIPNQPKWCGLCKIWCMGDHNFKEHLEGQKHIVQLHAFQKEKRAKQIIEIG
ncbi:hypothetical protein RGQ29_003771 [Quercus rubra]|uniref:Uncharacterized protein n=1 Tax=Quercus rubra TaxID=3512 RepID=A0AAN7IBT5_QUERU|nr:hypothetical protein RGQ29_003771 [Quercus rubra]